MTDAGSGFRRLDERVLHQGYIVSLVEARFTSPSGEEFSRDVVRTPSAVAMVPVDRGANGEWEVVLVSQFRAPVEQVVVEIPAGMCDVDGEPPEITAQRELEEEAGYRARVIRPLTTYLPASGFTDHRTAIVLGVGLDPVDRRADGIEEQHMSIERVSLAEAVSRVERGEITDGKTALGLLLAQRQLER